MITFGITNSSKYDTNSHKYMEVLLESIWQENIPDVEIIACGDYKNSRIKCIEFEGTISKKLNTLVDNSTKENIILIRDYMELKQGFLDGFKKFGFDWDLSMCVVLNKDNRRYRDWAVWRGDDLFPNDSWIQREKWTNGGKVVPGRVYIPSYDYTDTDRMYISGGLFMGKTKFFKENKFNNDLDIGDAEDVEWFDRCVRDKGINYKMNQYSIIKLQKQKDTIIPYTDKKYGTFEYCTEKFLEFHGTELAESLGNW